MPKKLFLQIVSRGNEHINSVRLKLNVTWKLQIFTSAVKKFIWRNFLEPEVSKNASEAGKVLVSCKLQGFFSASTNSLCSSHACQVRSADCVDLLDTFLVFNTFIRLLFWHFLTHLFGVSSSKFSKSKFSEKFGNSDSIVSRSECFTTCRLHRAVGERAPSGLVFTTGKHQINLKLRGFFYCHLFGKTSFQFIVR